jgi:hypothetical protein
MSLFFQLFTEIFKSTKTVAGGPLYFDFVIWNYLEEGFKDRARQGSSTLRPVDWFSAAHQDDKLFRSLGAISQIIKQMKFQKRIRSNIDSILSL